MTAAQVAMARCEDERLVKPLGRIVNSGDRMARMIDQLLDFTRLRVGDGIPIHPSPVELSGLLREVVDEISATNAGNGIRSEALGDTSGHWDADRLCQVFSNLLGNAVRHGAGQGLIQLRIDGTAADSVCVQVHNDGAISADLLRRVFEPMMGGEHRRERSQGLGLGLFISQEIAKAHGGMLRVESSSENGTMFTLTLPRSSEGEVR